MALEQRRLNFFLKINEELFDTRVL